MGFGNKILNGNIRNKIGEKVSKKLENNSVSIKDIKTDLYIPIKYQNSNIDNFLCKLKDAKIYSSWGFCFTSDNKIIKESLPFNKILTLKAELGGRFAFYKFRFRKKTNLNVFSLQSIWNVCFGHWMHETLPRLFILKDAGYLDKIDAFILGDGCNSKFHKDSLDMFQIDNKKIIYISDQTEILCENLYLSSFPSTNTHYPDIWICNKYRELSKELIKNYDINNFPKKIYLTRRNVKTRRILNEDNLMDILSKLGYKMICPEEYSLQEQLCMFYNADKIISILGSGLTNLVCSKETISVLGIVPNIRAEDTYKYIVETIGGQYLEYIENNEKNYVYQNMHNKGNDFDFYINIDDFKIVLDKFENIN
ncbi:capsular polysaccharide biosynthesis protein-like protein [Brachyspira suanatina]|uniref:Capsular polysaccharide biosynthesis protein-like protein n=1 Tax=Brachyspira suanatina TaxID=381802 RepID=A0A0G4K833_9SPIR|nr:glycosyltransferase family 61 protein [Brachyspira suanatina]CRF33875.1 capsular polysaccharide biosynthesis protein-like protein [Brachyspira suanatina]